jgi:hypothetical protein
MRALMLLLALSLSPAIADDGAASIAAGGLVMKRETRIIMAKEVLAISVNKVTVDYDFRNDTDADIATEVAFPIPPYSTGTDERPTKELRFDDFRLWVNRQPVHYSVDIRALVGTHDVTQSVERNHLSLTNFGKEPFGETEIDQIAKLPPNQRANLIKQGILTHGEYGDNANWTVHERYYWSQTFPSHATVHIRHEYTPVLGYSQVSPEILDPAALRKAHDATQAAEIRFNRDEFTSLCPSPAAVEKLRHTNGIIEPVWVDFILTTANTWKRPIEDFTLIVERTDPRDTVSFCWDGPVEKLDANHFQAHAANLIPTHELRIGFYHLDTRFNQP